MTTPHHPTEPSGHKAAEAAVRRAVVDADSPVVVTVSRHHGSMSADAVRLDARVVRQFGFPVVLHAMALNMLRHSGFFDDVYGYAVALPEDEVAYLCTVEGASSIAIGAHPHDHPRRQDLIDALAALVDAGPGRRMRPDGQAFPALSRIDPARMGPMPAPSTVDRRRHR